MKFSELDLSLGLTDNKGSVFYAGDGEGKLIVRTDSALKLYTITITISEKQVGSVWVKTRSKVDDIKIQIPTYQLIVTDNYTHKKEYYQVTRDTFFFKEQNIKKGFWSFLSLTFLESKKQVFENITFEPSIEEMEVFDISKYRKLKEDELHYLFKKENQNIQIFGGDINSLRVNKNTNYFIIIDENNGKRFIGDILYREKFLKLTPKIKLQVVKRKQVFKEIEINKSGQTNRLIYL